MTHPRPAPLIVIGSVNSDHVVRVERFPRAGETVVGSSYDVVVGGKGANQAAAAARSGASPTLVSAVGDDAEGRLLVEALASRGVDVSHVGHRVGERTGVALIAVAADGENTIIVAPGAAAAITPQAIAETVAAIAAPGSVLLAQIELPLEVVVAACRAATAAGARVVLNLSPAQDVPADVLRSADPLIVNASEAGYLAGHPVTGRADAERAVASVATRVASVVITLGGEGAVVGTATGVRHFPAPSVRVVDSTGAGDSFAGALAAALAAGEPLDSAVADGIAAGAAAVQYHGAQPPA